MKYISEEIRKEYEQWKPGDKIFITSPTGSGKTTFVLNELLPFVIKQDKKILYLVNRKLLKEQLEERLFRLTAKERAHICVETYQTIENMISSLQYNHMQMTYMPRGYHGAINYTQYDYVICDEAHYFLADATYNTRTWLSFRWIQDNFTCKIRVFLSATIEEIKRYIIKDDEKKVFSIQTPTYRLHNTLASRLTLQKETPEKTYTLMADYDYLNIQFVYSIEDIPKLISQPESGKWLIFVDDIAVGKKLRNSIRSVVESPVVLLTADYSEDYLAYHEFESIKHINMQNAQVLISTSVMDNGVSLEDWSLRNVVLMADTPVQFLQMLGRKRKDDKSVNLYIYKYDKQHFVQRLNRTNIIYKVATNYWEKAEKNIGSQMQHMAVLTDRNQYYNIEQLFICEEHKHLMQDIENKKIPYEAVRSAFFVYNGMFYLNLLAYEEIELLRNYYYQVIDDFVTNGEDAFFYRQLQWLGKNENESKNIISESKKSTSERCREAIIRGLLKAGKFTVNRELEIKETIRTDLRLIVELLPNDIPQKETRIRSFSRNDRPISKPDMQFLKEYCDIPYELVKEKNETTGEVICFFRELKKF